MISTSLRHWALLAVVAGLLAGSGCGRTVFEAPEETGTGGDLGGGTGGDVGGGTGGAVGGGTGGAIGGGTGGAAGGGTGGGVGTLTVTTLTLPSGVKGVAYSTQLGASGGTSPYTWSVTAGSLPNGLALSSTGTLSGTPTASGTFSFTVAVRDSSNPALVATAVLTLSVAPPLQIATMPAPPNGTVGGAYSTSFLATGGTPPYFFSAPAASLPPGLGLSSQGTLTGTPAALGTFSFTVTVRDSTTPQQTDAATFTIVVNGTGVLSVTTAALPSGLLGTAYSTSLGAANGTPPYSWSLTAGTLHPGLALSATGTLSGTPTASGTRTLTFQVKDSTAPTPQTATATLPLTVIPPLVITTTTLPAGAQASAYAASLAATGGTAPYAWSVASGSLPPGVTLNAATGALSGAPTASGTFSFTVQVADAASTPLTATASFSIAIAPLLAITTATLPSGLVGTAYSQTLAATGGTTPYTWSVSAGVLPPGLSLSSGGVLSGTPTATGVASFTVKVTDVSLPAQSVTKALTLPINGAGLLTITTSTTPTGVQGQAYSASFAASGGTTPYTWSVAAGALPPGVSLSSAGVLSGTPTSAGSFPVTIQAADTSVPQQTTTAPFTVVVAAPLLVSTTSLANGVAGTAYSATLAATGGVGATTWTLTGGALPAGLSLSPGGALTGTPTASGSFSMTFQVTDSGAPSQSATMTLTLTIAPALAITTASLPNGVSGSAYSATLSASGGTPAYSWTRTGGAFPAGLTLSTSGALTGTPTATGSFTVQLTVTDQGSPAQSQSKSFTFFVNGAGVLTVTTGSVPNGTLGVAYSAPLAATGGTTPYTWSVSAGVLPPGLSLNASTGVISGVPSTGGSYAFQVQAKDTSNPTAQTATALLQITVLSPLTITTAALPSGTQGVAYSTALAATGGTTPYAWSTSAGSLPPGLTLNAGTGLIFGTPTAGGTFTFTVMVTDTSAPQQTTTRQLSIVVTSPLVLSTTSLPGGVQGAPYSFALSASGGTTPYTFTVVAGALPTGLTLSASGVLSGTPLVTGTTTFQVRVRDSSAPAQNVFRTFTLTISPPLLVSTTSLPNGVVGVPYSAQLTATGGNPAYAWSVLGGTLPAGLTLSSSGLLSGTPTASAPYNFTVQVTDTTSPPTSTSKALSVLVSPAGTLTITTFSLPDGVRGAGYPATPFTATGGTSPYSWAVSAGGLPPGLTLSAAGSLTGTPTTTGVYAFTVTVTDAMSGTATRAFSIAVRAPLSITSPSPLPLMLAGQAVNLTLTGTGGLVPYTWSVASGTLPAGLSLSSSGVITGTPTGPTGSFVVTVQLTDSASPAQVTTKALTFRIDDALSISTVSPLPSGTVGTPYSVTLNTLGGVGPFTWTLFGALPPGLTLNTSTGVISGTPTFASNAFFIIRVTDALGLTAFKSFQLVVN